MHHVLAHLLDGPLAFHVPRGRRPVVLRDQALQLGANGLAILLLRLAGGVGERLLEGVLEHGSRRQQSRVPLPPLVDAGDGRVVDLIEDVQRQLQVVVAEGARRQVDAVKVDARSRPTLERCEQTGADRTSRLGQADASRMGLQLNRQRAHDRSSEAEGSASRLDGPS